MVKIHLTPLERETVITFNDGEDFAEVYTCQRTMLTKMEKLRAETPLCVLDREDAYSKWYIVPKSFVKVRPPRKVSEEQRAAAAENMKRLHNSKE